MTADCAGRVVVTATKATAAHPYAANGAPSKTAAVIAATAAASARYPPASRSTGDRRSAKAAATGASTAAGTNCTTATSPAVVAPPWL